MPGNGLFTGFTGTLDGAGQTSVPAFHIPTMPSIVGLEIFVAGGTLDASYPYGVKSISAPLAIIPE